jgi:acyl carrier protein
MIGAPYDATVGLLSAMQAVPDAIVAALRERPGALRGAADQVSFDVPLADAGVDSISLVFVFAHFEREHDVSFANEELDPRRYANLAEVAVAIERRVRAR